VAIASSREGVGLAVLGAALVAFLIQAWAVVPQLDDSYITYRYAQNLVEGVGLVYNPGERVEGFTSLLWTLIIAAGLWLGFDATGVGHVAGVASAVGALLATVALARALLPASSRWLGPVAAVLVLATTSFLRWSISGMETCLFVAVVTAALAAGARERLGWATGFLCIATATRPDGGIFALILFADALLRGTSPVSRVWRMSLVYGGILIVLTAFRLVYYGDVVPNTFHAKVGGVSFHLGPRFLGSFLRDGSGLLMLPALIAAVRDPRCRAGGACVAAVLAYVVAIGSDGFGQRFFVPIVPVLAALAVRGTVTAHAWRSWAGVIMALMLLAAVWQLVFGDVPAPVLAGMGLIAALDWLRRWLPPALPSAGLATGAAAVMLAGLVAAQPAWLDEVYRQWESPKRSRLLEGTLARDRYFEVKGEELARTFLSLDPDPTLVAAAGIGSLGYHSRLPILDLVGLVDSTISRHRVPASEGAATIAGHQRSNVEYILSRAPDYIVINRRPGADESWDHSVPAVADLWLHEALDRDYIWNGAIRAYRRRAPQPRRDPPDAKRSVETQGGAAE
jgi:hypothetical protein